MSDLWKKNILLRQIFSTIRLISEILINILSHQSHFLILPNPDHNVCWMCHNWMLLMVKSRTFPNLKHIKSRVHFYIQNSHTWHILKHIERRVMKGIRFIWSKARQLIMCSSSERKRNMLERNFPWQTFQSCLISPPVPSLIQLR